MTERGTKKEKNPPKNKGWKRCYTVYRIQRKPDKKVGEWASKEMRRSSLASGARARAVTLWHRNALEVVARPLLSLSPAGIRRVYPRRAQTRNRSFQARFNLTPRLLISPFNLSFFLCFLSAPAVDEARKKPSPMMLLSLSFFSARVVSRAPTPFYTSR